MDDVSSLLKETSKQYIEVYYRFFTSALFLDIFRVDLLSSLPSWIFVDVHGTSEVGSHNSIFSRNNYLKYAPYNRTCGVSDFNKD